MTPLIPYFADGFSFHELNVFAKTSSNLSWINPFWFEFKNSHSDLGVWDFSTSHFDVRWSITKKTRFEISKRSGFQKDKNRIDRIQKMKISWNRKFCQATKYTQFIPVPTQEEKCTVWAEVENKCTRDCLLTIPKP